MSAIVDFLKGIGAAIGAALDFLISTLRDLVYLVQLLGRFLTQIPAYLRFLPSGLVSIIVLAVTIAVLYKILGRDN